MYKLVFKVSIKALIIFLLVLIFLLASVLLANDSNIAANTTQIKALLDKNEFQIGDKISITYYIENVSDAKLIPPNLQETFGKFEVVSTSYDTINSSFTLCLLSFETGTFEIPALTLAFETNTERLFTKTSKSFTINISAPEVAADAALQEIPVILLDEDFFSLSSSYVLIAVVLLVLAVAVFIIRRIIK